MALIQRKTPEEQARVAAEKERQRQAAEAQRLVEKMERDRQAFFATPVGCARTSFERGDLVYQYSFSVMSQQAIIVPMVGSATSQTTSDPLEVVNAVCREGWELVNGSFVFVEQGQQSRDKFLSSGQNVATKGETVGYYLFRRSEDNRVTSPEPWANVVE
ncbi:hypothetical protein LO772_17075 [Yinghuangia sp. ASG 101]|uniref:hypothetical protein n=1 Tax=Yinghuangia sp. ASG 101 TaxID=2896848 RepID=UPI001E4BA117|nr:hypothetical protein [Yinghuangia sp. ASG 101]UGQ15124.1 hypothetical protein LO772_17075 [Yinghuangia sp. ASG 101]